MDSLRYRAMDLFRYALPGVLLITAFSLTLSEIRTPRDIFEILWPLVDLKSGILILFLGYFLGFSIDPIGKSLRYKVVDKIWKTPSANVDGKELTKSERYVLVQHFSPNVASMVETWDMLTGMACNFAIGVLYFIFVAIFKIFQCYPDVIWEWLRLVLFFALPITFLLLYQSYNYQRWAVEDLNAAIKFLDLDNRSKSKI